MTYILLFGTTAVGIFSYGSNQINDYVERLNLEATTGCLEELKQRIKKMYAPELLFSLYLDDVDHMLVDQLYRVDEDQMVLSDWFCPVDTSCSETIDDTMINL